MFPNYNALSASDGSGEAVRATVLSTREVGSANIDVNAITNYPTGTFIATTGTFLSSGKLDPTTVQVFYGTADGTTITITSFAAGYSDLGNAIGDVVVLKPTTEWANIVAQGMQSTTQFPSQFANFVEPAGGVWSTSSGLIGSMTAGNVWYNGVRSVIPVVTSKTFTASKDTYVDFNPATSVFTYVLETNGAAQPAVTSGCVRVALIVTGASAISSIYQAAYWKAVPLVWQYLGSIQVTTNQSTSSNTFVEIPGMTIPVTIPNGATALRATLTGRDINGIEVYCNTAIFTGATSAALTAQIGSSQAYVASNVGQFFPLHCRGFVKSPTAGPIYVTAAFAVNLGGSGGITYINAASTYPLTLEVECC